MQEHKFRQHPKLYPVDIKVSIHRAPGWLSQATDLVLAQVVIAGYWDRALRQATCSVHSLL